MTINNITTSIHQMEQQLNTVKQYVKLRWDGSDNAIILANYFEPNGCIVDAEGVEHTGFHNLVNYYKQPTPTPTEVKDPVTLRDGRVMVEFSVVKYMMTWNLKAYFEFVKNSTLLHK